jgi:hypothetical protein
VGEAMVHRTAQAERRGPVKDLPVGHSMLHAKEYAPYDGHVRSEGSTTKEPTTDEWVSMS